MVYVSESNYWLPSQIQCYVLLCYPSPFCLLGRPHICLVALIWRGLWSTAILCLLLVSNEVCPSPSFFGPWPLCPPTSVKITFVSPHLLADRSMYSLPHSQGSFESIDLCLTDLYPFHRHRTHFLLHIVCLRFYETAWDPSTEFFHLAIAILVLSSMLNTDLSERLDSSKPHVRTWRLGLLFLSYSQTPLGFPLAWNRIGAQDFFSEGVSDG